MRILWSPSPHATAELFEELKKGREQPDATKAAAISVDFVDEYNTDRFNPVIYDFVKKLPGVTSKNVYSILNRVNSLAELLACSQGDLIDIMGSTTNAESLYQSLHSPSNGLEGQLTVDQRFSSKCAKKVGGNKKSSINRFKSNPPCKK